MARAIWSGSVSFGLVNVPVKLYSATSPKSVRFNQINSATGARIKQKRVDETSGEEVPFENIVKGYELSKDRFVIIEPDELGSLAPKATKSIEIEEFVDSAEIDPIFYNSTYYLAPEAGAAKAYRLLVRAMEEAGEDGRVGLGRIILRSKESLVALRVKNGTLTASTMLFADEVLPESVASVDVDTPEPNEREVAMATALVDSLTTDFEPDKYRDKYREQVLELIERKAAGETIEMPKAEEEAAPAPDLMAALEASLAATGGSKPKKDAKKPAAGSKTRKKAAA